MISVCAGINKYTLYLDFNVFEAPHSQVSVIINEIIVNLESLCTCIFLSMNKLFQGNPFGMKIPFQRKATTTLILLIPLVIMLLYIILK
jgi:hypothetical protein